MMSEGLTWNSFVLIFDGLKTWVYSLYELLDSIVLIQMGTTELTLFGFGLFLLFMEVVLIIYLRLR